MKLNNETLAEYLALQEEIRIATIKIHIIKEACRQKGSFETENYTCTVRDHKVDELTGIDACVKALGRLNLEDLGLIKVTTHKIVHIKSKDKTLDLLS